MTQPPYQSRSADELMDGSGVKSASFDGMPPITHAGLVVEDARTEPQRDYDTNEPMFWPDGRPKEVVVSVIQTDERDPSDPDDDGRRSLWLRWRLKEATQAAIRRAGAKGAPKVGGYLSVTYTSDDHSQPHKNKPTCTPQCRPGKNHAPKEYSAEYRLPEPNDPWAERGPGDATPDSVGPAQGGWGQAYNVATGQAPQQSYIPPQQPLPQPAGPDPLVEFLGARNIDAAQLGPREQALMVAKNLGYQGQ